MGIDLEWKDETGATLDEAGDPHFHFSDIVMRIRLDRATKFAVVKTIDPFGTTLFVPPQLTNLLRELEMLRNQATDVAVSLTLGRFLSIIRAAEGASGTWLKFSGD